MAMAPSQQPRFATKSGSRPRSSEVQTHPKSANKIKEDSMSPRTRPSERDRLLSVPKKSIIPRRVNNNTVFNKTVRPVIMVPITQKQNTKTVYTNRAFTCLPDQETINRHEDLELQQSELIDGECDELMDKESYMSRNDKITQLKIWWQENIIQFEEMKSDLNEKQKAIIELYANLGKMHKQMSALGQKTSLPPTRELQIMNISNLTPEQLLQLCANEQFTNDHQAKHDLTKVESLFSEKLYNMPTKLVDACEQTMVKNKEMINELKTLLLTPGEVVNLKLFVNKMKDIYEENDKLSPFLEKIKNEFLLESKNLISFMRNTMKEKMALQSQKENLRKQLNEANHCKSHGNKNRIEDLEKQLKEEKCKNNLLKERLLRTTGQVKVTASQLQQATSNCRSLERTVQQLKDQNQQLHQDIELEFNKFSESIRENTLHLEEIAEARKNLQAEKEDLEKTLSELSNNYNESIRNIKQDMNMKVAKLIEYEKKYEDERDERLRLVEKVESLYTVQLETELRYKDMCKQLQDREIQLNSAMEYQKELEAMKSQLDKANTDIQRYREKFSEQSEELMQKEHNLRESMSMEENMKSDLRNKEEYARELEKKVDLLEQQRQDSENKMICYEQQLSMFKQHLVKLKNDFGEFENLNQLYDMIIQQGAKLLEATSHNAELEEALQKKDIEMQQHIKNIENQERLLEQRDNVLKMLSKKEEEHTNIIKLLKNNLEMRTHADIELSKKTSDMDNLVDNIDTKKHISQLEKIILNLEDQIQEASIQKTKDQEKINFLEYKLNSYEMIEMENKRNIDKPAEHLDSLIKILEDELISPLDPNIINSEEAYYGKKNITNKRITAIKTSYCHRIQDRNSSNDFVTDERVPNKSGIGYSNSRNPYNKNLDEIKYKLDVQRGITNTKAHKLTDSDRQTDNHYKMLSPSENTSKIRRKNSCATRNVNFLAPIQLREDKKYLKLFKIAGHRL